MGKHILKLLAMFMIVGLVSCTKSAEDDDEDDDDWGGGGVGTTSSFIFQGTTYSGVAQAVSATSGGSGKDVVIATSTGKSFILYNVPTASSGTYAIKDAYSSVTTPTNIWGIMQIGTTSAPMAYYTLNSGSVTKTSATSLTFTTQVSTNITGGSGTTVTGTASY